MREIMVRTWDLREFCARVNSQSPMQQVGVVIRGEISSIRGHPNPMRPVVLLIPSIRSYPANHAHYLPPSFSLLSATLPSLTQSEVIHLYLSMS